MNLVSKVNFFPSRTWLDERAFEAIFHEQYARVAEILYRLTGDRYQADELAAETFWRLWQQPPARNENVAGWLYRVATRLGYNALRADKRRDANETLAGRVGAFLRGESSDDPAAAAERDQESQQVRAVLRQMPLRSVQMLILRQEGLSYREIAAAAGVASGSVGTLLSRAERQFETLYRQGDEHAPS